MKITPLLLSGALVAVLALPVVGCAQTASESTTTTGTAAGTFGQGGHRHRGGRGFMHGALRGVNLSDQQKTQIKQIMDQFRQAHPRGSAPDPQARQQLRQQIMNVLTTDQQAQVKANFQQMRQRHQEQGETPNAQATPNV